MPFPAVAAPMLNNGLRCIRDPGKHISQKVKQRGDRFFVSDAQPQNVLCNKIVSSKGSTLLKIEDWNELTVDWSMPGSFSTLNCAGVAVGQTSCLLHSRSVCKIPTNFSLCSAELNNMKNIPPGVARPSMSNTGKTFKSLSPRNVFSSSWSKAVLTGFAIPGTWMANWAYPGLACILGIIGLIIRFMLFGEILRKRTIWHWSAVNSKQSNFGGK